jgi:hypothetical protein
MFDKFIWKLELITIATGIPNLNGEWYGTYTPDSEEPKTCSIIIEQTFARMTCTFRSREETDISQSHSVALKGVGDSCIQVHWAYSKYAGKSKWGYNFFTLIKDKENKTLEDVYFADEPTKGFIKVSIK